jgi:hypothetical protein
VIVALLGRTGGDSSVGLLFLGAFVVVIVGIAVGSKLAARRRERMLAEFAPSIGMEFLPRDDVTVTARLGRLPLFEKGRDRRAYNVMRGTSHGRRVAVFDYHYKTGGGKHTHHHRQTVAHVRAEGVDLPLFWLRPHGMLDKLASLVGMRDIDFTDDEDFSRRWFLKSNDEQAVRDLFTPRVRGQFAPDRPLHVEAGGPDLIVYREGKKADPDGIRALLEDAFRMTEVFTRAGTPGRS